MYGSDLQYHLYMYRCIHVNVLKKKNVPRQLLCPVCKNESVSMLVLLAQSTTEDYIRAIYKNEIDEESHVFFRCRACTRVRKNVNIIIITVQDTSNALSGVMAADDEESVIQLSRFLIFFFF